LIRHQPDEVLVLEGSGPVLGLQEAPAYAEGSVKLRSGDRLVAFTQGIIEALAAKTLRSAESVLIAMARHSENLGPAQLANRIVAECESARQGTQLDKSVFVACADDLPSASYGSQAMRASAMLAEA
jgi:serine phosphatase RsbU (regulator of sigma subunit)